jgi:hypothetical protein
VSAPRLYFNCVHIIESLRQGDDLHTGRPLYDDLGALADASTPPVKALLHVVQSRAQFLEALRSIAKEARLHSHWPILHIEAHGDFTGIYVTSGEYLPWGEFKDELTAINENSRLNLLVMMAACQGAWLSKVIASQVSGRAPMRLLIGPKQDVEARIFEQACPVFYRMLFDTGDSRAAWRAMNDAVAPGSLTFRAFTAEDIFHPTFKGSECPCRFFGLRVLHTTRRRGPVRHRPAGDEVGPQRTARPLAHLSTIGPGLLV